MPATHIARMIGEIPVAPLLDPTGAQTILGGDPGLITEPAAPTAHSLFGPRGAVLLAQGLGELRSHLEAVPHGGQTERAVSAAARTALRAGPLREIQRRQQRHPADGGQSLGEARSDSSRLHTESELVVSNVNQWVKEQK